MRLFQIFFLIFFLCSDLGANHITSASISYQCFGFGPTGKNYLFEMVVYRDCSGPGAQFDDPVNIGIYLGDNYYDTKIVELTEQSSIDVTSYPGCALDPSDYCFERAIYRFQITLPVSTESYKLFYTRCCWEEAIANMLAPEEQGITILSELTPFAQEECNSQDAYGFSFSRPFCANTEFDLTLPMMDSEGDSLAYKMCLPYKGGGLLGVNGTAGMNDCDGILPDPAACPPVEEPIDLMPGFTVGNPFPTVDGFHLGDQTGELSFTPTVQGIYIFGVCVEEYRDGELLSSRIVSLAKWDRMLSNTNEIEGNNFKLISKSNNHLEFLAEQIINGDLQVDILDVQGKAIGSNFDIDSKSIYLDYSRIESGIYFIRFLNKKSLKVMKVFLE